MEMSDQIIKVLDELGSRLGIAVDWTQANVTPKVMELCSKYIRWEIATSIMSLIFGVIVLALGIWCCHYACTHTDSFSWEADDGDIAKEIFATIGCVVFVLCGIGVTLTQIMDIIKCITFPELQIYQFITQLMQSK